MRALKIWLSVGVVGMIAALVMAGHAGRAQGAGQPQMAPAKSDAVVSGLPDYVEWPLPDADRAYGAIDGHHIWQYVVEEAEISHHYRDQGHPQFWGRIIGTSGDAESAQWLLNKFKKIGMTDTHIQPLDLAPQYIAQSWQVTVNAGGKTLALASAQPSEATPATPPEGLDVEAVYVGLGREADFVGRDVRGKAAFVFLSGEDANFSGEQLAALKRASKKGAVAIFAVNTLPGNIKVQTYPVDTAVPTFSLVLKEGQAVRDLIAHAPAGEAPHVKILLNAEMVPNLKSALVWGTLPGATDETIYVTAHRDGWFDAAGDNGGGVASMVGLAEYFAKVPKSQRRRTMVFIGLDGHHNSCASEIPSKWCQPGAVGNAWLIAHKADYFTKTALIINDEHPSNVGTYMAGDHSSASVLGRQNSYFPVEWYAGGASRPALGKIASDAFREFGVTMWAQPSPNPPAGDLGGFSQFLPGVSASSDRFFYFHTDGNTPETVPWTGLEAVTRAYAKIIDQVNKIDLKDLQGQPSTDTRRPTE